MGYDFFREAMDAKMGTFRSVKFKKSKQQRNDTDMINIGVFP